MKSLSPQMTRIVALVALLVVAGGGAISLWLRSTSRTAPQTVTTAQAPSHPATPVPSKPAKAPDAKTATPPAVAAPASAPAKPAPKPAHRGNLVDARLPAPLQWALSQHRIVVVSFYDPSAQVDAISVAEAHAGAADARVGFLLVNVLDDKVAGPLTALLPGGGLLPNPGVLVYRAPGRVVYRFDGFADRQTVAQAAANAKAGETASAVTDPGLAASATGATGATP